MIVGYLLAQFENAVAADDYTAQSRIATALIPLANDGKVTEKEIIDIITGGKHD
jgi:hypothetical protein